jgi:beta-lactamase class C
MFVYVSSSTSLYLRLSRQLLVISFLISLALLKSTLAFASPSNPFQQKLAEIEKSNQLVGLAVAVVGDGKLTFLDTYGVQEVASADKITAETTFRIASLSKAFAATVAIQLDVEGKLSLDDSLVSSNPDFKLKNQTQVNAATLRHALSHRLSLPLTHTITC